MFIKYPKFILPFFILLSILGAFLAATRLEFEFDFEQFFPQGDEDLEFFLEFKEQFEPDDIYLLVALPKEDGVFDQPYLQRVLDFSLAARRLTIEAGPKAAKTKVLDSLSGDSTINQHYRASLVPSHTAYKVLCVCGSLESSVSRTLLLLYI